jgi:hypothetical protein
VANPLSTPSASMAIAATGKPVETSLSRMRALGRLKQGTMNKLEEAYAGELELRKRIGQVSWYAFEAVKLRLADATFYSPDFAVMLSNGELEMHEVKGFWQDDARAKIKIAASLFPLRFVAIKRVRKAWEVEEF